MNASKKAGPGGSATFDPWAATFDEAQAAQVVTQVEASYLQPLFQWAAAQRVTSARAACEGGDGFSVMECIHLCAWHGLVMPDWLAGDFMRRYRLVNHAKVGSWDKAFGLPYPKGTQLSRIRFRRRARLAIHTDVLRAIQFDPNRPIDEGLFGEIGAKHGAGKTQAEELYRQALNLGLPNVAEVKRELTAQSRRPAISKKLPGTKIRR